MAALLIGSATVATAEGAAAARIQPSARDASPASPGAELAHRQTARQQDAGDGGVARFYRQSVRWTACNEGDAPLECARVLVPVDWARPSDAVVSLSVRRHRATGTRQGSFVVNPGGPGASGAEILPTLAKAFGKDLLAAFDLVSWDPRGVGASSPLTCPPSAEAALTAVDTSPDTLTERKSLEAAVTRWAHACRQASGPLFDHVDTLSNVRDLDVLRAVLGDAKLTYGGFSYGSRIGIWYADMFPDLVSRMLLDSSVDPAGDNAAFLTGQSLGADRGVDDYLAGCAGRSGCPLTSLTTAQARQRISAVIRDADTPVARSGSARPVRQEDVVNTVAALVRSPRSWPALDAVLAGLLKGDTEPLSEYLDDGPTDVANVAINCMDLPDRRSARQVLADAERTAERTVLGWEIMSSTFCPQWPVPPTIRPRPVTAAGAAPILVVATTRDTATPFEWGRSTASHLESGRLLTLDGSGHVGYSRNACVTEAVDRYLVAGRLPAEGTVCRG